MVHIITLCLGDKAHVVTPLGDLVSAGIAATVVTSIAQLVGELVFVIQQDGDLGDLVFVVQQDATAMRGPTGGRFEGYDRTGGRLHPWPPFSCE